ncbi:MAG TPA: hypothetical protein VJH95_05300 [Candidatus Nanoarchaeia archaeon]|nr:hypothetical protein [Candidatus Nanoarchaeia archaeon]
MYEARIKEHFSNIPVFSLSDVNQIINNRQYSKKFLKKMVKNKEVFKIKKNLYTLHDDPFLISTFVVKPSYISSISALSYYKLITQIPKEVFCITTKRSSEIRFMEKIRFFHTDYFFGFKDIFYENARLRIAEPEKALIDSFNIIPVSVFEEAFESINKEKMINYLKKIKKSCVIKRVGYLMEKYGYDAHKELKKYINYRYIPLDPLQKQGRSNKKWKLLI